MPESLPFVDARNINFSYYSDFKGQEDNAINNISIKVFTGQHVVILGPNGSGKSTLAKLINGLLLADKGEILVLGMNTASEDDIWSIRQICGMVFQNPDNQIVGTTLEEDVAFGPENLGIPSHEIRKRVDSALAEVGLTEYAQKSPTQLSGGQKQKLAIAGILSMQPKCIILDESTSMLDPQASRDLMSLVYTLKKDYNLTIVDITHDVENAIFADYSYVLQAGEIYMEGRPRDIFSQPGKILAAGLDLPKHLLTVYELINAYPPHVLKEMQTKFPQGIFTVEEAEEAIAFLEDKDILNHSEHADKNLTRVQVSHKPVIKIENLSFSYQKGSDQEVKALRNINLEINQGELVSLIGHSGSGKSTLVSHLNGLIMPQTGEVRVFDYSTSKKADIENIRKRVGLLFQYPEHQLFENTVYEDISFGPKQFHMPKDKLKENVEKAIKIVNLDPDLLDRSPFELSGGQQRRAAIAGVIAMDCDIYVLDEPAAGLDPLGKREIFSYISELRKEGKTIILVTHDMNLAAEISDRIIVLQDGQVSAFGETLDIFSNQGLLDEAGLAMPDAYIFSILLSKRFGHDLSALTAFQLKEKLLTYFSLKQSRFKDIEILNGREGS